MLGANLPLVEALSGISGILVTPFDAEDRYTPTLLDVLIDKSVAAGVDTLVANGNTGEFYALTMREAEQAVSEIAQRVGGRVPVIGGVGRGISEACKLAKASRSAGVDALMIHQPPDPFVAPSGVVDYINRIADAVPDLPLVLYLRNDSIGMDTILRLAEMPCIFGIKWASRSISMLAEVIRQSKPDVPWICGLAETWAAPMAAVGANGFTSGLINVWPERSVDIRDALRASDYVSAMRLVNEISAFEAVRAEELGGANVSGVKVALQLIGIDCGAARPPAAWPLSDDQIGRLKQVLVQSGLC